MNDKPCRKNKKKLTEIWYYGRTKPKCGDKLGLMIDFNKGTLRFYINKID